MNVQKSKKKEEKDLEREERKGIGREGSREAPRWSYHSNGMRHLTAKRRRWIVREGRPGEKPNSIRALDEGETTRER